MIVEVNGKFTEKTYNKGEPYLCPVCDKVWQFTENHLYMQYILGFPKYGCTDRKCRQCKETERKYDKSKKVNQTKKLLQRRNKKNGSSGKGSNQGSKKRSKKAPKKRRSLVNRVNE